VIFGVARAREPLLPRLGSLSALLLFELIAVSIWLDTQTLRGSQGLAALVGDYGPAAIRFAVAFALIVLIFGNTSSPEERGRLNAGLSTLGVDWAILVAHLGFALLFAYISAILFSTPLAPVFDNALALLWITTGLSAVVLAALAFLPVTLWTTLFQRLRSVLTFGLSMSLAASALGWLALNFWQSQSRATLWVAYLMVRPFAPDVTADPVALIIGNPAFSVEISRECSGYEGLGLIFVFTSAWLWFHRTSWRFPHALALIPLGLVAAWTLNCVRIACLLYIGMAGAPDIAFGGFHSQFGWLSFNGIALGICLLSRHVAWLTEEGTHQSDSLSSNRTAVYLVPFVALLAAAMFSQLLSGDFEWLYPIRVIGTVAALGYFVGAYRSLDWRIGWMSLGLGVCAFATWIGLDWLLDNGVPLAMPSALANADDPARVSWLVIRVLGAAVTVPIAEELAFRGYLLRRFASPGFELVNRHTVTVMAVLLSSLAFGILHSDRWIAASIAGAIYAVAYLRRGSIGDAVAAHATTNALIALWVLGGGDWRLW
jgi:exosortase E/protease (VPEID-CTERM system)